MIIVLAKNFIKEDQINAYLALAKKLVIETNKNDQGCIRYELYQDMENPKVLTMIEEWENRDALDKHMAAKHFREIVPVLGGFAERPGEVNMYRKVD